MTKIDYAYYMFVLLLTLFLSVSIKAQVPTPVPLAPLDIQPSLVITPDASAGGSTQLSAVCSRIVLPEGCTCHDGLMKPAVNCVCADIYKKLTKIYKVWVNYDQHNQCVINYFPGCNPKLLNSSDEDLCQKYGRAKNKLTELVKPALTCDQMENLCPDKYRFRCLESPDSLDINCVGKESLGFSLKTQN